MRHRLAAAVVLLAALPVTAVVGLTGATLFMAAMDRPTSSSTGPLVLAGAVVMLATPAVLFLLVRAAFRLDRSTRSARSH